MKHPLLGLCILLLLGSTLSHAAPPNWSREALRLTGESASVREASLRRIKNIPRLHSLLRKELRGRRQALALDIIAALKLKAFVPELLRLAEKDCHGFVYHTINTLVTPANQARISKVYQRRLFNPGPQGIGPCQVVLLETLGILGHRLPTKDLETLLTTSSWPEVQGAVLNYARIAVLQDRRDEYVFLVTKALTAKSLQVRTQARFLAQELALKVKP